MIVIYGIDVNSYNHQYVKTADDVIGFINDAVAPGTQLFELFPWRKYVLTDNDANTLDTS